MPLTSEQRAEAWSARALEYIDSHASEIVSALSDLVRLPSVSGTDEENAIQDVLSRQLDDMGLDVDHWSIPLTETLSAADFPGVEVDRREAWGLVGRLPGRDGGPTLMLNTHVDVVPTGELDTWDGAEPFSGLIDSTTVYGRGACDMKAGLVAAHWATRALAAVRVPLHGDLLIACVQGEEDGGLGTYSMLQRGWRADACVIPEPTSLDVSPASGGSLTFRLHIRGLATHASRRTSGVSAIEKFLPIFSALRRLEAERNRDPDPLMAPWDIAFPIEIGTIQAGTWPSSVPEALSAEGRYGVALDEDVEDARNVFERMIEETCAADPWLRDHPVEVQWWGGQFASGRTALDSPIIAAVRDAHRSVSGYEQRTWGSPYGSDLRLMTTLGGVPTVHYGPGDARLAHGPGERVDIGEVLTACRALAMLAINHCGVG